MRLFSWLRKTFGGMVTEADNKTHSIIKHGGWIGLLAVLVHDAYQLAHGIQTNVKDLAFAVCAILAGCGAGVGVSAAAGAEHKEEGPQ